MGSLGGVHAVAKADNEGSSGAVADSTSLMIWHYSSPRLMSFVISAAITVGTCSVSFESLESCPLFRSHERQSAVWCQINVWSMTLNSISWNASIRAQVLRVHSKGSMSGKLRLCGFRSLLRRLADMDRWQCTINHWYSLDMDVVDGTFRVTWWSWPVTNWFVWSIWHFLEGHN